MPSFQTLKRVLVPPAIAFAVASDVERYKEFLPLLESSKLVGPVTEENAVKTFRAQLVVGYGKLNIRESFTSHVTCDGNALTVKAVSQDPPFKDMTTVWTIRAAGDHSDVAISINYTMRSLMMQMILSGAMAMAVEKILAAFESRALSLRAT